MNQSMVWQVLMLAVACTTPCLAAPVQWPMLAGGNGHYYDVKFVRDAVTWDDALAAAAGLSVEGNAGFLATITSQAEQDFIVGTFGDNVRAKWLGGFQPPGSIEPAGGWQWITGEPFIFTNWRMGEPNNSGGNEDRLEFFTANFDPLGVWNDLNGEAPPATFVNGYVVEIVPEPSAILIAAMSIIGLVAFGWHRRG